MKKTDFISLAIEKNALVATLEIEKILEEETVENIEKTIKDELADSKSDYLIIDFSKVQFLTSSFLGYLIRLNKQITSQNKELRLCSINDKIYGIFKITRLDKIFDIHADKEKALLSLGQI